MRGGSAELPQLRREGTVLWPDVAAWSVQGVGAAFPVGACPRVCGAADVICQAALLAAQRLMPFLGQGRLGRSRGLQAAGGGAQVGFPDSGGLLGLAGRGPQKPDFKNCSSLSNSSLIYLFLN